MIAHKGKNYDTWAELVAALEKERDAALLQVREAVALIQGLVVEVHHGKLGLCTCDPCTAARNFLTRHFEKRNAGPQKKECRHIAQTCECYEQE